MRKEIENWFKADRDFESGKNLLMKHSQNLMLKASLQRGAISINILQYELGKLIGATEATYKGWLAAALKPKAVTERLPDIKETIEPQAEETTQQPDVDAMPYAEALALAQELGLEIASRKKAVVVEALKEHYEKKK